MNDNIDQIKISLVSFEEAKEDIISILNRNRPPVLDESYFSWRYSDIFGKSITCLAEVNGKKIGLLTFFPRPLKVQNKKVILADIGDLSVDEGYRRRGISVELLKEAMAEARKSTMDFCFCIPNELAKRSLLKAGWKEIGTIRHFKKVINTRAGLNRIVNNSFLSRPLGCALNLFLRLASIESFINSKNYQLIEVDRINADFDLLWQRASNTIQIARIRDRRFLQWRFLKKPLQSEKYKIFELRKNNDLKGYIVILISPFTATIVDIFCFKSDILHLIDKTILYLRKSKQMNSIRVALSDKNPYTAAFKLFGFIPTKWQLSVCCHTNLNNTNYQHFMDIKNWFITLADKDTI